MAQRDTTHLFNDNETKISTSSGGYQLLMAKETKLMHALGFCRCPTLQSRLMENKLQNHLQSNNLNVQYCKCTLEVVFLQIQ